HVLAGRLIRHADDGHVGDPRVRGQLVLYALGGQVLALADDDVLAPARDAQIAVGVEDGEVSRAEEAVGGERAVERRVEIADAQLRAVRLPLSLHAGAHRASLRVDQASDRSRHRAAVGAVELLLAVAAPAGREHRTLGHAVRPEGEGPETLLHLSHELRGDACGARTAAARR